MTVDQDLEKLRRILPPPRAESDSLDWELVERLVGVALPDGYKALIGVYGRGSISNEFVFHSPFVDGGIDPLAGPRVLSSSAAVQVRALDFLREAGSDALPLTEGGWPLVWATEATGVDVLWLVDPDAIPNDWPIAFGDGPPWAIFRGSAPAFLVALLDGSLGDPLDGLVGVTEPEFLPF